jgi:hypothetical protein
MDRGSEYQSHQNIPTRPKERSSSAQDKRPETGKRSLQGEAEQNRNKISINIPAGVAAAVRVARAVAASVRHDASGKG